MSALRRGKRRPSASSLRARLISAAVLAIVAAITALGITVTLLLDHQLHASLDTTLQARARDVARLSASAPALLTTSGALDAPLGGRLLSVEVVDHRGRIVARSASLGGRLLPEGSLLTAALERGRDGYSSSTLSGESVRVYVAPLAETGGQASGGAVLVASSTSEIQQSLERLRALVAVSALSAALLGAIAAGLLTGRGLRPLRRLSAAARQIERTGDATRRLPISDAQDEVGELGQTLNGMLDALERARERERRFLADASHELRTPLTSLRGNAAYVARHGADPGAIADIEADAARLGRLLDDLLTLEREDAAAPPAVPVWIDELARLVAKEDPRIEVVAPAPVAVNGERGALERALLNLLENARVHGPPEGRIEVRVEARAGRALLSVDDAGHGIAPDEVELAFRRFWRGSLDRPGSGLGLAIVATIAERHGGQVSVDGARITLDLPALKDLSRSVDTVSDVQLPGRS